MLVYTWKMIPLVCGLRLMRQTSRKLHADAGIGEEYNTYESNTHRRARTHTSKHSQKKLKDNRFNTHVGKKIDYLTISYHHRVPGFAPKRTATCCGRGARS